MEQKGMNDTRISDLNLGIVGNCRISALIDRNGAVVWGCLPHFAGDPVFCNLVDTGSAEGLWEFELENFVRSEQRYIANTAILETCLYDDRGGAIRIVDFAPRFMQDEKIHNPAALCRIVTTLAGAPRVRMNLKPRFASGSAAPEIAREGNVTAYKGEKLSVTLTADAPQGDCFTPAQPACYWLDVSGPCENVSAAAADALKRTTAWWREFTRALTLPFEWQHEVIRSAITLKLCTYEETGAIVAALTTSIPEAPGSQRNWDYRFCWLRDALFTLTALNRLGTTQSMVNYFRFVMKIAETGQELQPLYGIHLGTRAEEMESTLLAGYRGMGPVRFGNQAYVQQQNDVWGSVILALAQSFADARCESMGTIEDFQKLEAFGESAARFFDKPDAGIWEFRTIDRVHTFSAVMCWVACDRLARIAGWLGIEDRRVYWREKADAIHAAVMEHGWSEKHQSFVEPFGGEHLDASLLLLHEVGFIDAKDPKFVKTVDAIGKKLMRDKLLYRYVYEDDFGRPEVAFTVCAFWYVDALAACGREEEARAHFTWLLGLRNHLGILSEDLHFKTHELWGNYPQTYSMVGIINSALRLSKSWREGI
jgi:GH15 family glucan-1,4-alpha-glucosidase